MYAKIYNYKFQGLSEAKVAATFCSEALGKKIIKFNIRSLNISIGQCGSVAIHLKFETSLDLKNFEDNLSPCKRLDACLRATKNKCVNILSALISVNYLKVLSMSHNRVFI